MIPEIHLLPERDHGRLRCRPNAQPCEAMLDRCLTCFERQDTPPAPFVVRNATPTDGTEDTPAEHHPNVLTLTTGRTSDRCLFGSREFSE